LQRQDLIPQHIEDYSVTARNKHVMLMGIDTVYNAAGMANFQASPPKISFQSSARDHDLFSRSFSLITTALQINSLRTSLRKTAVDVKYRSPLITGMIRE
jgi:hypothetical protein